jgi:hypothetical protein
MASAIRRQSKDTSRADAAQSQHSPPEAQNVQKLHIYASLLLYLTHGSFANGFALHGQAVTGMYAPRKFSTSLPLFTASDKSQGFSSTLYAQRHLRESFLKELKDGFTGIMLARVWAINTLLNMFQRAEARQATTLEQINSWQQLEVALRCSFKLYIRAYTYAISGFIQDKRFSLKNPLQRGPP